MYIPPHFAEARSEELQRVIRDAPLGVLITQGPAGLEADHLPFEFDAEAGAHGLLSAHVARANDIWQRCPTGSQVLVVFRGAEAYISPSWYPSKHEAHRQVPTWNYEVVHAHGVLRILDDEKFARRIVARLTQRHEVGEEQPWKMGDAPREYIDQLLSQIVGIEIDVTRLEGKRKLGQNKEERDRLGAISGLERRGERDLAEAMRRGLSRSGWACPEFCV